MRVNKQLLAGAAALGLVGVMAGPAALAQDDASAPTSVIEREVVNAKLDADGEVSAARLYSQLVVTGDGTVEVSDPTSTRKLRNLEGFTRPALSSDRATWKMKTKDGVAQARTVADFDGDLPVEIVPRYELDGQEVSPGALVGRSGEVTVTYSVRNISSTPTEISFKDANGVTRTETAQVPLPLVGSLSLTLDDRFSNVTAEGAAVAGDGRGNTRVTWSMIMFEPLGMLEQEVSYTARVNDAVVPAASLSAVPARSDQSPLSTGTKSFRDAAGSLTELANGAEKIDQNLTRLSVGAGSLLDGLTQLADGANALADGLGTAASGSGELSAGMTKARTGGGELASGLGDLRDGAGKLSDGLGTARSGGGDLADGLDQLAAGAGTLSDGLGAARKGSGDLSSGLGDLAAGAKKLDASTVDILDGTGKLRAGNAGLRDNLELLRSTLNGPEGTAKLIAGVDQINAGVTNLIAGIGSAAAADTLLNGLAQLDAGLSNPACDLADPRNAANPCGVLQVLGLLRAGIGDASTPDTLLNGVARIQGGLSNPACDLNNPTDPANPCGLRQGGEGIVGGSDLLLANVANLRTALADIDASALSPTDQARLQQAIVALGDPIEGVAPDTVKSGLQRVRAGGQSVASGAQRLIDEGLGTKDTPKTLRFGIDQIDQGLAGLEGAVGTPAAPRTLRNGIARISGGLDNPAAFAPGANSNPLCLRLGDPGYKPGMEPCGVKQGLQRVSGGLDNPRAVSNPGCLAQGQLGYVPGTDCGLKQGLELSRARVNAALGSRTDGATESLIGGANALAGGSRDLDEGVKRFRREGTSPLAAGAGRAADGSNSLVSGLGQLDDGGQRLAAGADSASAGAGRLADGLGQLDDGGKQLAEGAGKAAAGGAQLADGLGQLDDGAAKLANGLGDAADGSGRLADGLGTAKLGGTQIADGSKQLQEQGTSKLAVGVNEGVAEQNKKVAAIAALAERGQTAGMPFGAPEGGDGSAAYVFDLASATGEGGENATRGLLALGALLGVGAVSGLRQRRILA